MKKKANIYDADDVERSKRLNFTPEERAARAEHKAEVLGTKLEKAKKKVPKKKKLRLQKELDPEKSKLKHTLRFEEVEKKRGQEALPKKAGRRMVQSASATVHSKIHQVEEENVGTKAAHRTELASEGAAALASHEIRKYRQNAPYKRVEKLEAQVNRANVSAAYRAAVRDNPELQENTVKRLIQKQRIKHQYAKEFRKGFGAVALENLDEEQKERYTATLSLKGNKPYLFGSDIYANESAGEDYDIPGEALADPDFAALIAEAEKYLGFPYVWGGSSPSTSFDCSGFVCYVYTHSGVHNLPRTTAQGIYNQCAHIPMSEAKPGDIIFFTGTYNSPGPVSHVGIYVGNNMMIHCGSPIQYARTDSSYWSQHFYAIGRLN